MSLDLLFEQFLRERIYLRNVTSKPRDWYESARRAFKASRAKSEASDTITRADLAQFVVHLRSRAVTPSSSIRRLLRPYTAAHPQRSYR
jgi:site-specific recombinase XerD